MTQRSGFLLVELSLALILAALSLALMLPLLTQITLPQKPTHTTLLKAHYDVAHALRMITPIISVELLPEKIVARGSVGKIVSISCVGGGCILTKEDKNISILPRSHTSSFQLTKRSASLMNLSLTFSNGESSLTLIHPLYIL